MLCPKCSTSNLDATKFCTNCGTSLTGSAPVGARPTPPLPITPVAKPKSNFLVYLLLGVIMVLVVGGGIGYLVLKLKLTTTTPTTEATQPTTAPEKSTSPFGNIAQEPEETPTEKTPLATADVNFSQPSDFCLTLGGGSFSAGTFKASLISVQNGPEALRISYTLSCETAEESSSVCYEKDDHRCCAVPSFNYSGKCIKEYNPAIDGYVLDEATGEKYLVQTRSEDGAIKGTQIQSGTKLTEGQSKEMWLEFNPLPQTTETITIKLGFIDAFTSIPVD